MTDAEINKLKIKSAERKRNLREMNDKIRLFQAMTDAAISDAARWKRESDYWKLRAELFERELRTLEAINGGT